MDIINKSNKKSIFILGDSIAFHYGPYLKKMIEDEFDFFTKKGEEEARENLDNPVGSNGGDSLQVLSFLEQEYANSEIKYNYLLLNCGLHDVKSDPKTGVFQKPIDQYKINLTKTLELMSKTETKVIWVNTTPVDNEIHNTTIDMFYRFNEDVISYNTQASEIVNSFNIPIIDLYNFTLKFGKAAYCDHVHFNENTRQLQAAYISGFISCYSNSKTRGDDC